MDKTRSTLKTKKKRCLEKIAEDFKEGLHAGTFEKYIYFNPLILGSASYYCYIKRYDSYAGLFGIASIGTGLLALFHTYCMGRIKKEVEAENIF